MTSAKRLFMHLAFASIGLHMHVFAGTAKQPPAPASATRAKAEEGRISYYGSRFAGRTTASGERFNPDALTMAHRSLPFGTHVKVSRPNTPHSVVLRVNDRGPATPGRIADVSHAAAAKLGMLRAGVVVARLEVIGPVPQAKDSAAKKTS